MTFNNKFTLSALLCSQLIPCMSFAYNSEHLKSFYNSALQINKYRPLAVFTVGPDFINAGQAQNLTLYPPYQNHYTKTNNSQTVADVGGFLGVERKINKRLRIQLGVSGYGDSQITAKGDVWQFADPLFANLSYSYRIAHARVMFTNKILTTIPQYTKLYPYFSWEVGTAYNNANGYLESPLIPNAVPLTPFANHHKSSFAWGVGLGIDHKINRHVRAGIGYQFSDLGAASLGPTTAALTSQSLSLDHIYANQLRFQFTFI